MERTSVGISTQGWTSPQRGLISNMQPPRRETAHLVTHIPFASCQGLTVFAEALVIPRTVLGPESCLRVEEVTLPVAALT